MRTYGMYVSDNFEEMIRFRKNIVKVILGVFVLNIIYYVFGIYLINQSYINLKTELLDKNILFIFPPQISDYLFFLAITCMLNLFSLIGFTKKPSGDALKKKKNITSLIGLIMINILFLFVSSLHIEYGYVLRNDIGFYGYRYGSIEKYDIKNIRYVDVDLEKTKFNDLFINYEINFDSGVYVNLKSFYNVTYKGLAEIDNQISNLNIKIERPKLSEEKQRDIFRWLQKYPEDLEPFKEILKL
ncbi:MAG: hypothetical protein AB6733_16555 [Clostridiaceae bacterium]